MVARAVLLLTLAGALSGCGGSGVLSAEPGGGALSPGQSVLVDDGKCPAGQFNKVTAPKSLTGTRSYACVAKPSSWF